jgi:ATP-dependent RNA helicase RhlE
MNFESLQLIPALVQAVHAEGYTTPTPIQQQAIPHVLSGKDLLGLAQTGTGKTAAFALPILQRLTQSVSSTTPRDPRRPRDIRVLVLTPTRELASQIGDSFTTYGKHTNIRNAVIFGGVGQAHQERVLRDGIDVLIATPGRLLDLYNQRLVRFDRLEVFVLDEADRMLDMGFIHDVRKVIATLPRERQTLFFSATMPPEAQNLADSILKNPARVAVTPVSSTAERIAQTVYFAEKSDKRKLLEWLLRDASMTRVLVFTRTKHGANRVAEGLSDIGIGAAAIHGNKSQNARERALAAFKSGSIRVLVATDIAARGIDIDQITHVVNFELPEVPETYVHRIGRTARAGASGLAMSFCQFDERPLLADVERLTRQKIPVIADHPYVSTGPASSSAQDPFARPPMASRGNSRGRGFRPSGSGFAGGGQGPRPAGVGHNDRPNPPRR